MKYKFTKFGFINALWTLIPIFPIWTIIPGVLAAEGIEGMGIGCQGSYTVVLWICIVLIIGSTTVFISRLNETIINQRSIKRNFRWFSFFIYMLANIAGLILMIGTYLACNGDGQTLLVAMLSGPVANVMIIILGYVIDVKVNGRFF